MMRLLIEHERDRLRAENEELREQLRQANDRASDADADWYACFDKLQTAEAAMRGVVEDMCEYANDPALAATVADWANRLVGGSRA